MRIQSYNVDRSVQQAANTAARKAGCGMATEIEFSLPRGDSPRVIEASPSHYKTTRGDYIAYPNAYRKRGASNMVYHPTKCLVAVPKSWEIFIK